MLENSAFVSLHSYPVTYPTGVSGVDFTSPLSGVKEQLNPTGVVGCLLGYPSELGEPPICVPLNNSVSIEFRGSNFVADKNFRVFIPAGTTSFSLSTIRYLRAPGTVPPPHTVVMRIGGLPTLQGSPSTALVSSIETEALSGFFDKLLSGFEVFNTVTDTTSFGTPWNILQTPAGYGQVLQQGQWLYVRSLTRGLIGDLVVSYSFDLDVFKQGYDSLAFDGQGDPPSVEGGGDPVVSPPIVPPAPPLESLRIERKNARDDEPLAPDHPDYVLARYTNIYPVPADAILPPLIVTPAGHHAQIEIRPAHTVLESLGRQSNPLFGNGLFTITAGDRQITFTGG